MGGSYWMGRTAARTAENSGACQMQTASRRSSHPPRQRVAFHACTHLFHTLHSAVRLVIPLTPPYPRRLYRLTPRRFRSGHAPTLSWPVTTRPHHFPPNFLTPIVPRAPAAAATSPNSPSPLPHPPPPLIYPRFDSRGSESPHPPHKTCRPVQSPTNERTGHVSSSPFMAPLTESARATFPTSQSLCLGSIYSARGAFFAKPCSAFSLVPPLLLPSWLAWWRC